MLTRKEVLDHIRQNPGITNTHLATFFGTTVGLMATKLKQYINGGYVTRIEGPRSITGVKTYLYSAAQGVEGKPKQERVKIAKRTLSQAPTPQGLSLEALVNELANTIAQQVLAKVQRNLANGMHMLASPTIHEERRVEIDYAPVVGVLSTPQVAVEPAKVLPKVGVVGLLPQQAGSLSEKFAGVLDFSFWSADDAFSKLDAMGKNCEVVFLHTRHIGHTTDKYLGGCAAKVVRVTGGTSNMFARIKDYFAK